MFGLVRRTKYQTKITAQHCMLFTLGIIAQLLFKLPKGRKIQYEMQIISDHYL